MPRIVVIRMLDHALRQRLMIQWQGLEICVLRQLRCRGIVIGLQSQIRSDTLVGSLVAINLVQTSTMVTAAPQDNFT